MALQLRFCPPGRLEGPRRAPELTHPRGSHLHVLCEVAVLQLGLPADWHCGPALVRQLGPPRLFRVPGAREAAAATLPVAAPWQGAGHMVGTLKAGSLMPRPRGRC